MALALADRVQETTTTTGTGTITLAGAVAQCQSFSAGVGTGNTTYYTLLSGDGASWEVGLGTVGGTGPYTLARTTIFDGSAGTSPISLTGTSIVFCDLPASKVGGGGSSAAGPFAPLWTTIPTMAGTGLSTWINQGSTTASDVSNGIAVSQPGHTGDSFGLLSMAAPATPYSFAGVFSMTTFPTNYTQIGIGWYNSANGNMHLLELEWDASLQTIVEEWNSPTSYNSTNNSAPWVGGPLGFKIRDDGTTVYFYTSADGVQFNLQFSIAKSSGFLGSSGYNTIVFGIDANPNTTATVLMGWLKGTS